VTIAFEDAGYLVEVIPAFDHVLSFQMSPLPGGLIGTFTPLHPLATSKEMLGRQILENIAKAGDDLEGEAEGDLYQNAIHGFRFNTSTLVRADARFPEHSGVKGSRPGFMKTGHRYRWGDTQTRSFNVRNEGPRPFAGSFSIHGKGSPLASVR